MAQRADYERVVVSGVGALTALGLDARRSWERLVAGDSGIRPITLFATEGCRTTLAAEVLPGAAEEGFSPRERRRMARTDRIAVKAALQAVHDAGLSLDPIPPRRRAVVLGAGASGLYEAEAYFDELLKLGPRRAHLSKAMSYFPSAATDWVAARLDARGYRSTVVTACSSSAIAIGQAYDVLRDGRADVAITGGADTLSRLTFHGFNALRATDPAPCRPFDRARAGISLGEAAAMLVLERLEDVRRRGGRPYAEVLGYGVRCDAHHMTAPDPEGDGALRTMRDALSMAGVAPGEVGYVNAHGTATELNDKTETLAIKRLLGPAAADVWVSSTKAAFGHCLGAAGGLEAVVLALSLHHGIVPPTLRWRDRDADCDLDYVPNVARERRYRVGLSNSFAFGGNNAALVLGRIDG